MKIAIVHDWLVTNAGAEKVLKDIIDIYPKVGGDAVLYCKAYDIKEKIEQLLR